MALILVLTGVVFILCLVILRLNFIVERVSDEIINRDESKLIIYNKCYKVSKGKNDNYIAEYAVLRSLISELGLSLEYDKYCNKMKKIENRRK